MLVLTRKKNQSIIINGEIEIIISDISGDQVKIAIKAPRSIKIFRKEIYEQILKENLAAVQGISKEDLSILSDIKKDK